MNKKLIVLLFIATLIGYLIYTKRAQCPTDSCVTRQQSNHLPPLKVGTNAEYPPFCFIENDTIVGFDIDLITMIAQRLEKKIVIHNMSFIALIPQLQIGMIDVIAAGMSPTEERSKHVAFSQAYSGQQGLIAVVPTRFYPDASKDILIWLKNKNIVVNEGFIADFFISQKGFANKKLPSVSDALIALRTAQAQVFVTGSASMQPFFEQYGTKEFKGVVIPDTIEPIALVINKKNNELIKSIKRVIDQLQQEGILDELKRKWHIG